MLGRVGTLGSLVLKNQQHVLPLVGMYSREQREPEEHNVNMRTNKCVYRPAVVVSFWFFRRRRGAPER